jgi:hypothetical protein
LAVATLVWMGLLRPPARCLRGLSYFSAPTAPLSQGRHQVKLALLVEAKLDLGSLDREGQMSKVTALISDDQPIIRIYGDDSEEYAEIQFSTQSDANVAVERLNELFKTATGLSLSTSLRIRGT